MREIKFRAWSGVEMWYPETLSADDNNTVLKLYNPLKGIKWGLYEGVYGNRLASGEYHKLMQYTGLKDKNGNPVYEGDIILLGDNTYDYRYESGDKVLVKWGEHTGFIPFQSWHSDYDPIYDFEIIGNIYENPELIDNAK